ncbi:Myosin-binding protein 1 [Glycine soja]|uniref:cellulase n=1 Tax=Glycine soja TaxID=3848 RepID=A0A445I6H9_GLYSO|nr:Myosin-binding protein 1 [Glycine soja]
MLHNQEILEWYLKRMGEVLQKIGTEETTSTNTHPVVCDSAPINPKEENSNAEASSLNKVQIFRKSSSVESGLDSLDESNISEIQRESNDDRLRRRIEYYKKCNDSLQKEVEEERNASAVATNEAMSIITRLQEEKAALEMEALQYFRMMEKQAEYDNDELEKVNGLLTEKEKEIQDLEAELEFYRSNMTSSNGSLEDHLACKNNTPPLSWQARIRIAAETAAALAAASMIFKKVFQFADKYRGPYSNGLKPVVCPFYCSYSGYEVRMSCCGVLHTWLHKATKNPMYLNYIKVNGQTLGAADSNNTFGWDNKHV